MFYKTLRLIALAPVILSAHLKDVTCEVRQGYEQASLNWNINGGKGGPNILSELEWKDLQAWRSEVAVEAQFEKQFIFKAEGGYGKIYKGYNTDKDYGKSGRRALFSSSRAQADKGELYDVFALLGSQIYTDCQPWVITPYISYIFSEQHVRMDSPAHLSYIGPNDPFDPSEEVFHTSIEGLSSHYRAQWYGPGVGLDVLLALEGIDVMSALEYYWLDYSGSGHWNLRPDFLDDFKHHGHGHGVRFKLGGSIQFCSRWNVDLLGTYANYRMVNGTATYIFDEGDHIAIGKSKLNEVNWHAFIITVGLGYRF